MIAKNQVKAEEFVQPVYFSIVWLLPVPTWLSDEVDPEFIWHIK